MSDPFEPTRRSMFAMIAGLPAGKAIAAGLSGELSRSAADTAAPSRGMSTDQVLPSRPGAVSVKDFGAVGDGKTDDSRAFQAAVDAARYIFVPPGRYKLGRPIRLSNGQRIFGTGKSAWEPYTEAAAFPDITRSEILIDGILAIDASRTNSVTIMGIAIKAVRGRQSVWGYPAGKQPGTIGFDITGSSQFEARDVSFHGLDIGVDGNQAAGSPDTQMPSIADWTACDCGTVFRFGNAQSDAYTVRDARIADCAAAIHCDAIVDAHRCDGLRLENLRLFHGNGRSIYVRETPFVSFSAVTVFETSENQVTLKDCRYVSLSGLLLARAGGYKGAQPYPQKVALTLVNCGDVRVEAQIQQPTGKAIDIVACSNVNIAGSVGIPFWMTGNQNNDDGAIGIRASTAVNINAAFGGSGRDYWASVWADTLSGQTLSGSVSSDRSIGVVRATALQQQGGYRFDVPAEMRLSAGDKQVFASMRILIPAGKKLKSRSVEIDHHPAQLCITSKSDGKTIIWESREELLKDDGGVISLGCICTDDLVLHDNRAGPGGWYLIELALRNPTNRLLTIPKGAQVRLSTAIT